jgi:hypothetical protein
VSSQKLVTIAVRSTRVSGFVLQTPTEKERTCNASQKIGNSMLEVRDSKRISSLHRAS